MSKIIREKRPPGRPRDDKVRTAILRAANSLLEKRGLSGFTVEGVAAAAGVAKTTIYRDWPSKGSLAIAGFLAETAPQISYEETASPLADLRQQLEKVVAVYAGRAGRVMAAIIAQGQYEPETINAFITEYVRPRREAAKAVLARAIACGEIRADIDMEVVLDAIYGPITYRLLVPHLPLNNDWIQELSDVVLKGIRLDTETAPPD